MECISVFDMLKIGVGPSSSHTLGPWRAAERWLEELKSDNIIKNITHIKIDLFGSLSLTGKGHATDIAIMLGLSGENPETIPTNNIDSIINKINTNSEIILGNEYPIGFNSKTEIVFNKTFLDFHSNGLSFIAFNNDEIIHESTFYSIGGGFVVKEESLVNKENLELKKEFPFPIEKATELLEYCNSENKMISEIVLENELSLRDKDTIDFELKRIWDTMLECMYLGCHTEGYLPGGLNVRRRAFDMHKKLIGDETYTTRKEWISSIRKTEVKFRQILKWVSCFALGVNEVNASLGRVITAPTNGSAGVIPAVLMYYLVIENHKAD
ncbi:L-serine ammonia-lyase, partial [Aurantibacter sp.]|uniref:L-serine ammonia-lyase n=1 Tax=Aurantibacter sp. TaxID=2807103 RepID=UPI0035C7B2FC